MYTAIGNSATRTGRAVADTAGVIGRGMAQLPAKTVLASRQMAQVPVRAAVQSMLFDPTPEQRPTVMSLPRSSTLTQPVQRQTAKRIFRG